MYIHMYTPASNIHIQCIYTHPHTRDIPLILGPRQELLSLPMRSAPNRVAPHGVCRDLFDYRKTWAVILPLCNKPGVWLYMATSTSYLCHNYRSHNPTIPPFPFSRFTRLFIVSQNVSVSNRRTAKCLCDVIDVASRLWRHTDILPLGSLAGIANRWCHCLAWIKR